MRFARKLVLALWLAILLVFLLNGFVRYRREVELLEDDIQRDHEVMGRGLGAAVAELWEDEGQARALNIVERANRRESSVQIRWVDLEADGVGRAGSPPAEVVAAVAAGSVVRWLDSGEVQRLYTYVPLRVGGVWTGALELSETLEAEHAYLRASLIRTLLTLGSLAIASGVVVVALGGRFVGRPIRLLVEKARRVGAGDFEGPLVLVQDDELGELAAEMNTMSARLAAARDAVEAEATARAQAMAELRHAERLTTVGKLASGVAHELGTPLNVIHLRARMIADGEVESGAAREAARVICEQSERITRIVRQLLDFARQRTPDRALQDVAALVERAVGLLAPTARRLGVQVAVATDGPILASVDAVQIQQVLTNLLINGVQAMPGGGQLHVRVRRAAIAGGAAVEIEVEDEGTGMDETTRDHIFDPFFTTKDIGVGTGLGLSVAHGIVLEHGGSIEVESHPGAGSRFTVLLPVSR